MRTADHPYDETKQKKHSYPGKLDAFPFAAGGDKATREWLRALGSETSFKGLGAADSSAQTPAFNVPDNKPLPATPMDYYTTRDECRALLRGGLFDASSPVPNFLYCSILVPHPPYGTRYCVH